MNQPIPWLRTMPRWPRVAALPSGPQTEHPIAEAVGGAIGATLAAAIRWFPRFIVWCVAWVLFLAVWSVVKIVMLVVAGIKRIGGSGGETETP